MLIKDIISRRRLYPTAFTVGSRQETSDVVTRIKLEFRVNKKSCWTDNSIPTPNNERMKLNILRMPLLLFMVSLTKSKTM